MLLDKNKVYTLKEASTFLRVANATVTKLIKAGKLTAFKAGKSWRIFELDLIDYVESTKESGTENG